MRYLKFLTAHLLKYVEVSIHLDKKSAHNLSVDWMVMG